MTEKLDLGERCIWCGHSVEYGSGRFINRIPAEDRRYVGYYCEDCQLTNAYGEGVDND